MNASVNSTDAIRRVAHGQLSYRALTTPQWSVPGWWDRTAAAHIRGPATRSCRGTSPWLKWGYRRPAAASPAHMQSCLARRTGPDVSSRLCIGWPRGDARGSFHSYSHAKRGASPLRLPACRAGQQCFSPPSCRPGPQSSRSGSVFPRSRTKRPRPATRALMLLLPLVATPASPIREPGRPARLPPAPRRRRPCPTNARQGSPWW
jgi:hypothetical protein